MERQSSRGRVAEGEILWEPPRERKGREPNIARYMRWLEANRGLGFEGYSDLWQWSVSDLEGFWSSIWEFFEIRAHQPYERVLSGLRMPGARWFEGAHLNYAEHSLSRRDDHVALMASSESRAPVTLTYAELYRQTAACAAGLRKLGVKRGDRVVAYLPNIPEALIAFLATASIGAIWSSCSPEFGIRSVVERFQQVEPKVLIAVDGYRYRGKHHDRLPWVVELQSALSTLEATVIVPYFSEHPSLDGVANARTWRDLLVDTPDLYFEPVPFEHPLWILYSSGTTGLPKAIVQGHGGILLEHLKALSLHLDLDEDDRFFWYTSTGWMMWNFLIGGLHLGVTLVLHDGHPGHPDMGVLWRLAQDTGMTHFGTSGPYIQACMKEGIDPAREFDLTAIRGLGSTGAPLPPEGFRWVYDHVNSELMLNSFAGGTDLCTGFMGACPILAVRAGEITCRLLGANLDVYDDDGRPLVDRAGELVITAPMPSMPLFLWNDRGDRRYAESYFEMFPGVWRHGDLVKITTRGSLVIYGRSDATLNRGGLRMGTSEFYRVVDEFPEVIDSLVVDTGKLGAEGKLLLLVVLRDDAGLDQGLKDWINQAIRQHLSPRYVPDEILAIPEVPTTLSGKKMEVPVKRVLQGTPMDEAVSRDAMSNPEALAYIVELVGKPGATT